MRVLLEAGKIKAFKKAFDEFCRRRQQFYDKDIIQKASKGDFSGLRDTKVKHLYTVLHELFYSELNGFDGAKGAINAAIAADDLEALKRAFSFFEMAWLGEGLPYDHKGLFYYIDLLTRISLA